MATCASRFSVAMAVGACLSAIAVGLSGCTPDSLVRSDEPSIVFILTDDQRFDTLDHMPTVQSELVDKGVTFTNAFVSNPLCCPSRATILTGQYAHSTGVWTNKYGFEEFQQDGSTIATWLKSAGYRTGLFGKYLNGYAGTTYVPPGWDRWVAFDGAQNPFDYYYRYTLNVDGKLVSHGRDPAEYSTDLLASEAAKFIRETSGSLFVYFAPYGPHTPATPAPEDEGSFADLQPYRPPSFDEVDVSDKPAWVQARQRLTLSDRAKIDALRRNTYETLQSVDRAVGKLMDALRESGRLHNTQIVFTSDNGYLWGEHRFANKAVAYEEAIRVPLVVRYDRLVTTPRKDDHLLLNLDLAPTFADFAHVSAPGAQGMSFLPLLRSGDHPWRDEFLIEHVALLRVPSFCGVRSQRYAYVHYQTGEEELYDLDTDPYEMRNLAGEPSMKGPLEQLRGTERELCNPRPPARPREPSGDQSGD